MFESLKNKIYQLLRWSEKYTKTDMVYLAKGGFWLSAGQAFSSLFSFILAVALGYLLPKETYGSYKYIIAVWGVITAFSLTGIGTAIVQAVAKGFDGTLIKGFFLNLKWSIFITIISLGGAGYYFLQSNYYLTLAFLIIGLFSPLLKGFELYNAYLKGKQDFSSSAKFSTLADFVAMICLVGTAYFFPQQPLLLVVAFLGSYTIMNGIFFLIVRKRIKDEDQVDFSNLNFSKHLSLMNILSNLSAQLDKILIFHFLGAAQVAIYTFSVAIPKQIRGLLSISSVLAAPKYSKKNIIEIKKSVPEKFISSLLIMVPIILVYIVLAPYIYKIFFPKYLDSVFYSQVYVLVLLVMGNMSDLGLIAMKAVKEKYFLHTISSVLNIVLMFIFVQFWGILGIIVGTLIAKIISGIIAYLLLKFLPEQTRDDATL